MDESLVPSPIGKHVRHVLDFYGCFLDGLPTKRIDYTGRMRETRIETDTDQAVSRCAQIQTRLAEVASESHGESELVVQGDIGLSRSTPARELEHLALHTVHHFAIVSHILRAFGRPVPKDFGKAPSTIRYESGLQGG
jgi:uncharacterized damage-inducible protein DinB